MNSATRGAAAGAHSSARTVADPAFDFGSRLDKNGNEIPREQGARTLLWPQFAIARRSQPIPAPHKRPGTSVEFCAAARDFLRSLGALVVV